jgi:hypothetical protein
MSAAPRFTTKLAGQEILPIGAIEGIGIPVAQGLN